MEIIYVFTGVLTYHTEVLRMEVIEGHHQQLSSQIREADARYELAPLL
jgi:hypothetical protein